MGATGEQMEGVLPWLAHWASRAGTRYFCPALAALVSPVQNIFFSRPYTISSYRPASWQAVVQGRLSVNVCLWL